MDSSPIVIARKDGGRACPSAQEIHMHEVLATLDQCMTLQGESCIVLHHLQQESHSHGCAALNQLELLLRIVDHVDSDSLLCQLLLWLDEQGIFISSPWQQHQGQVIVEALWPQLWQAWRAKELAAPIVRHVAALFSDAKAQANWDQAKLCIQALKSLGKHDILAVAALRGHAGQRLAQKVGCMRRCNLSKKEYDTLILWLDRADVSSVSDEVA